MAESLIGAKNEKDFVQTFKKFEKEQDKRELSRALTDVAKAPEHMPKVVTCLRTIVDPFPKEVSTVSELVDGTIGLISNDTLDDTEPFAKVIASFKPSDVKPLASIRYWTLRRDDAVKVLESVMTKSPELITDNLSRWLASHGFDLNSSFYTFHKVAREQAFKYLTSFATEDVLNGALAIVKANQHYQVNFLYYCCDSQDSFPHDLVNKLNALLAFVKDRNELIKEALAVLPKVLVDMVIDNLRASTD